MVKRHTQFWRYLPQSWIKWSALGIITLLPLVVYRLTASSSIGWIDSGVIATAAASLGIANPPGFPSYMLLAHLFTKLPWGNVVDRLAMLSQLSTLGSLIIVWSLTRQFLRQRPYRELAAVICTLCVAFSYSVWSQSINVETYTLTNFSILAMLWVGLWLDDQVTQWQEVASARGKQEKTLQQQLWKKITLGVVGVGVLLGLASGLNPIAAAIMPALGWWLWRRREIVIERWPIFIAAAGVSTILFCAVYSYLPLRAAAHPYLNWGSPTTLPLIWNHLTGAGLDIYEPETNSINGFTGQPIVWWTSFWHYLHLGVLQFTPILVPLIVWGWWRARQLQPQVWSLQMAVVGFNLLFIILYYGGNQESWMITSWLMAGTWLGVGLSELLAWTKLQRPQWQRIVVVMICAVPVALVGFWWPLLDRHTHAYAEDYAQNLLRELPQNAVLIGGGDFWNSLTAYEHEVTQRRPDLTYITFNMFYIFPWYRENLHHHTDLKITPELEAMTEPVSVDGPTKILEQLVADNPDRQFFITPLLLRDSIVAGTSEGVYKPTNFDVIPEGLLLKIVPKSATPAAPVVERFDFHLNPADALAKRPFYLERNYTGAFNLLRNEYGDAYDALAKWQANNTQLSAAEKTYLRGMALTGAQVPTLVHHTAIFYAQQGLLEKARPYFEKSLALDPFSSVIQQNFQIFQQQMASASGQRPSSQPSQDQTPPLDPNTYHHLTPTGLRFLLPVGWSVEQDGERENSTTILKSPPEVSGKFTITFRRHSAVSEADWETFLAQQKKYGVLINSGPAQFPQTTKAFLKVWLPLADLAKYADASGRVDQSKIDKIFQFFLLKENGTIEVTVTPTTSPSMKTFDAIMASLEVVDAKK